MEILTILADFELNAPDYYIKEKGEHAKTTEFAKDGGQEFAGYATYVMDINQKEWGIVTPEGEVKTVSEYYSNIGIRLGVNKKLIKFIPWENKKYIKGTEVMSAEFGEYPQTPALNIDRETLVKSEKQRTIIEDGKLVVRNEYTDQEGNRYVEKKGVLYKVEPIEWIVYNDKLAITKNNITGGLPFGKYPKKTWITMTKAPSYITYDENPATIENYVYKTLMPEIVPTTVTVKILGEFREHEKAVELEKETAKKRRQAIKKAKRFVTNTPRIMFKMQSLQENYEKLFAAERELLYHSEPANFAELPETEQIRKFAERIAEMPITLEEVLAVLPNDETKGNVARTRKQQ